MNSNNFKKRIFDISTLYLSLHQLCFMHSGDSGGR